MRSFARNHRRCPRACALALAACLLFSALCISGCAKQSQPPAMDEIYDVAVDLIERSHAVNDLILGYGLPTWRIGSAYANRLYMYADREYADYEYVTDYAPYSGIADIKDEMEQIYSADYLNSLYVTLFDGFVGGAGVVRAQYSEDGSALLQSVGIQPLLQGQRIYDYATMRMATPSNADYVTIELDTHLEHQADTLTVRLGLVREKDGWRLDTPTF